ncbi:hypothetical protein SAMN02746041_02487 [Desulfacinum hydrothermale DSM 13146]|uniref:Uncharacterized protein n=1 Tax=Desulfacinum hydrothermale DSM 13146 TaxID=1121390 RepID=A0A1W1XQ40_9BACT|nr:DUF6691 family protein [Desulfacinum hydrothermale]SMC25987.1 hypothetical protein SAMN02746041_02487 [Desulfacinum hydrothermale DSM 13146]
MTQVLLGLFSGIAFGFIVQRIGATDPDKMARAHLMVEPQIPQFMMLAVAFSALGLAGLQAVGVGRTVILPTSLAATGIAAVIFGIGWGLCGYCPGTCWAAAGEGRLDALFALLGGLAGTALFAHFHEGIIAAIYLPTNQGPLTLADWVGNRFAAAVLLAAVFGASAWAVGKIWGRHSGHGSEEAE